MTSRREQRKEETRRELIAAAATAFARRGFHGASLEEIAREAGYSTGAVYWHFKGKDDLFLAVFEAYARERAAEYGAIRERTRGEPLAARERALADDWMRKVDEDPDAVVLVLEFAAHAWRDPALREELGRRMAIVRETLGGFLEEDAREHGAELPLPARDVATALREMGVGLALARLAEPGLRSDLFGDFVETYFRLLTEP